MATSILPQNTNVLGRRNAKYLLAKTSFNITKARIDTFAAMTPAQALEVLFDFSYDANWLSDIHPNELMVDNNNSVVRKMIYQWWLEKAREDTTAHHKILLFLFTSFTVDAVVSSPRFFYEYLKLLSLHTKRSYKELAFYMTKDNVMLAYLDGRTNIKNSPNENYAREFFELFTIGKGPTDGPGSYTNYTEEDILQASKLLTGWKQGSHLLYENADPSIYGGYFKNSVHDEGDKTFSDKFNNTVITGNADDGDQELSQFVDMVFQQLATAKNICRRLYHFFVSDKISTHAESNIIDPLAQMLYDNNYEIAVVIKELLGSLHFYDMEDDNPFDNIIGGTVKSPLDLMLSSLSYFGVEATDAYKFYALRLNDLYLSSSSMSLFSPDNVAGYPAYYQEPLRSKNWFDSNTYLPRYKFVELLLTGKSSYGTSANGNGHAKLDILSFIDNTDNIPLPYSAHQVVTTLLEDLFPDGYDNERYNYYLNTIFLNGLSPSDWTQTWDAYKNGDNEAFTQVDATEEIKIRVANLIQAIMQSPEYQLM